MAIEVKTPPLTKNRNNAHLQCIAQSKRSALISNAMDTYVINVEGNYFIPIEWIFY